jgi:hypothetical protein
MFLDVNGDQLRPLMRFIQSSFEEYALKLNGELPLQGQPKNIMDVAASILSRDDSSLQWSEPGGGVSENPSVTLEQLYVRLVEKYELRAQLPSRTDDEVWRGFKKELEVKQVLAKLQPKRIVAKDYEHEFDHAWKNGTWNLYQPISFDLIDAESLLDKANRWLGRATILQESQEKFKLHMLLGEPRLEKLKLSYEKALNILNRMPVKKEFIREDEAVKFSKTLAKEIEQHK